MTIDNVLEILEKHKLHIPSNVFYELKADIVNFEEPTTKDDAPENNVGNREPTTKNDLGVDCIDRNSIKYYPGTGGYMYASKGEIDKLPSVTPQEPRWIPVSERLPKPDEYVGNVAKYYLVQNVYGDMLVARYTHSEYWEQIYQLKPVADEIVAWMPLPKPPHFKATKE